MPSQRPVYHSSYANLPPSVGDPWPDRPEIAAEYFAAERAVKDPPAPQWPEAETLKEARAKLNGAHSIKSKPVTFEQLQSTQAYPSRPAGMGARKTMPRIQIADNHESAVEKEERDRRRQWVERAIRHGWEGYKSA